jgi:hypothetical protein
MLNPLNNDIVLHQGTVIGTVMLHTDTMYPVLSEEDETKKTTALNAGTVKSSATFTIRILLKSLTTLHGIFSPFQVNNLFISFISV